MNYVEQIKECYYRNGNAINAIPMKHYLRDQFECIGIKTPKRREITRPFLKKSMLPPISDVDAVIREFWALDGREFQYFAQELAMKYLKQINKEAIKTYEFMIVNKSWWDTIDIIAKKLVGNYMLTFPEERDGILSKWLDSNNIWLQRSCLLFQLGYKEDTDVNCLFDVIRRLKTIDEFFIQKAIGWSLREYSKVNREAVFTFINGTALSKLARSEGLKIIQKQIESEK